MRIGTTGLNRLLPALLAVAGMAAAAVVAQADDSAGVLAVDPVELVQGREVAGKESIRAEHYRYGYLFANEGNRTEFLTHPERYEIQLGGACARMGALSGLGKTDLFAVHDGHIYIFASEGCRSRFLSDPQTYLDAGDPPPSGAPEARAAGLRWIDRVIEAMGGADRLAGVRNYQWVRSGQKEWQGKTYRHEDRVTIVPPDRVRSDYIWGDSVYSKTLVGDDAWAGEPDGSFPLHDQQRDAMEKEYLGQTLFSILRARSTPGFTAVYLGPIQADYDGAATTLERVAVAAHGATSILTLDPKSARVLTQTYRGHGPSAAYGEVVKSYTDYRDFDGFLYPAASSVRFEGKDVPADPDRTVTVQFDVDLPGDMFAAPKMSGGK